MRKTRETKTYTVDLSIPIDRSIFSGEPQDSCFGKEWDLSDRKCSLCNDKDICGIQFQDTVNKKAKELEAKIGTPYLDLSDFKSVTKTALSRRLKFGKTTTAQLIQIVGELACSGDTVAIKEYIKNNKPTLGITIKSGIVYEQ